MEEDSLYLQFRLLEHIGDPLLFVDAPQLQRITLTIDNIMFLGFTLRDSVETQEEMETSLWREHLESLVLK
jgi:hypothetical protein